MSAFDSDRRDAGYVVSSDRARIDLDVVHGFLARQSYWCRGIPRDVVERAVANSLCCASACTRCRRGLIRAPLHPVRRLDRRPPVRRSALPVW